MKQVAVWKTVLFTVLSLGIYSIYWVASRRKMMREKYKNVGPIPHWFWLLFIPILCGMLLVSWLVICVLIILNASPISTYDSTAYTLGALLYAIPLVIGLWWLWYFGKAIEVVTQGRMPRIWTLFLYLFVGPFVIAFHQYYINRLKENKKGETYDVGSGFLVVAAAFGILSIAGLISSVATYPQQIQEGRAELLSLREKAKASGDLLNEYTSCVDALNKQFPAGSVTSENQAAYDAEAAKCSEKYEAYKKSIDAF